MLVRVSVRLRRPWSDHHHPTGGQQRQAHISVSPFHKHSACTLTRTPKVCDGCKAGTLGLTKYGEQFAWLAHFSPEAASITEDPQGTGLGDTDGARHACWDWGSGLPTGRRTGAASLYITQPGPNLGLRRRGSTGGRTGGPPRIRAARPASPSALSSLPSPSVALRATPGPRRMLESVRYRPCNYHHYSRSRLSFVIFNRRGKQCRSKCLRRRNIFLPLLEREKQQQKQTEKKKKRRQNSMETRHAVGGVLHDFGSSGGAGVRGARPGPRRPSQPSLPARVSAVAIAFRCNYDQTTLSPEACLS